MSVQNFGTARWLVAIGLALFIGSAAAAQAQGITRTSSWTYSPTTGLVTSETIQSDRTSGCVYSGGETTCAVTTSYTYDSYGNKIATTVTGTSMPAALDGSGNNTLSNGNPITRTTTTTYDSQGEFALTVTNALGQSESYTYDARFGVPLTHTGPNGLTTSWAYDSLGRKTAQTAVDGTVTEQSFYYNQNNSPLEAYLIITQHLSKDKQVQTAPFTEDVYDTLGRPLIHYVQVPSTNSYGYYWSTYTTTYNANGQVASKTLPVASTTVPSANPTTYAYDILGRVTTQTNPNGGVVTYTYNGLSTSVTDPQGHTTTTLNNMMGLAQSVTDAAGSVLTYTYDALGDLTQVTDQNGNVTTYLYDNEGRKKAMTDPDRGSWTFAYDAIGELISQTDAKGQTTNMTYDVLGRMLTRTQPGQTDYWIYDTEANGIGKLANATSWNTNTGRDFQSRELNYDALGRPTQTNYRYWAAWNSPNGSTTVSYQVGYNANTGQIASVSYPSQNFTLSYSYFPIGTVMSAAANGATIWTWNVNAANGQLTKETFGNGVVVNNTYDPNTGQLTSTTAGFGANDSSVANFAYTYDNMGNLTERQDNIELSSDTVTYDNLYRLSTITTTYYNGNGVFGPPMHKAISYDVLGNITYRSEIGTYNYGGAGPHQVQSITGGNNTGFTSTNYSYDANGNATSGDGYTTQWNSFNMVSSVQQGTVTDAFTYDADHNRASQTESNNGSVLNTIYYFFDPITGLEADYTTAPNGSTVNWKDYVKIAGQLIMVHTITPSSTAGVNNYFVQDHLGSVAVVVQDTPSGCSGAALGVANSCVLERDSYDAWGLRRNSNGTDLPIGPSSYNFSVEKKGYTGQEQLQGVGLLNYNARMYDPLVGKFLSADPDVELGNLQAMNPYTYAMNNPLSNTDPTGMKCHGGLLHGCVSLGEVLDVVAIAVAVVLQQDWALPELLQTEAGLTAAEAGFASAVIAGAAASAISSEGNLEAIGIGAFEGGAFFEVGTLTNAHFGLPGGTNVNGQTLTQWASQDPGEFAENVVGHGLVGGLASVMGGGHFGSGFVAAGFSDAAGVGLNEIGADNIATEAAAGGVGSVLGGGKFANGAETGAYGYLFNTIAGKIVGGVVGVAADAACDLGSEGACIAADAEIEGAAIKAGDVASDAIGSFSVADGLKFGTTLFGDAAHAAFGDVLQSLYPNAQFIFRLLPGQTGVDIEVANANGEAINWTYGELKPLTASGMRAFYRQITNWGLGAVKAFTYDSEGNYYEGF